MRPCLLATAVVLGLSLPVRCYIPALPTNSTSAAVAGGLNLTDISNLRLQWYSNGSYSEHVSYQLAGNGSNGISKGVLVHFSEEMASELTPPTLTPWIALVSCDKNATNASMDLDVFTLARDKGAVSALLYSLSAAACIINPAYSDPSSFDQVFDIFSTQSGTSSHLIEYQFGQLSPQNKSIFAYNSQQLNDSFSDIVLSINTSTPVSAGYLLAILEAYNATGDSNGPSNPGSDAGNTNPSSPGSPNTALAMIILYAITGCVSALFCVVIISGAIRAIRHPERYGPRARVGVNGGPAQSRARGLTRAILDTFPIVKFGSNPAVAHELSSPDVTDKDIERRTQDRNIELGRMSLLDEPVSTSSDVFKASSPADLSKSMSTENASGLDISPENFKSLQRPISPSPSRASAVIQSLANDVVEGSSRGLVRASTGPGGQGDVVMASIGRETCPICIVDFEEGDDIRVLPCEGKHCFHQTCVDPWLLKLSSSCPICRHDFLTLEHILCRTQDNENDDPENVVSYPMGPGHANRFSRYLRFVHRRRRQGRENDSTDPYMPTTPESSVYPGM